LSPIVTLINLLDLLPMAAALAAAWLWFLASRTRLRRVSQFEELNAADLNRLVVTINRNQILNSRGALAATAAALCSALRLAADAFSR
jgi:hypothetical protein